MEYISLTFILFTLLLMLCTTVHGVSFQENIEQKKPVSTKPNIAPKNPFHAQNNSPAIIHLNFTDKHLVKTLAEESISPNTTNNKTQPVVVINKTTQPEKTTDTGQTLSEVEEKAGELGPGAIGRAVVVFVLVSFVFLLYVGFKTCRRKRVDKAKTFVHRKYGVRTTRSDMEMEPLPLSDDEDDNTIFDSRINLISERGSINN